MNRCKRVKLLVAVLSILAPTVFAGGMRLVSQDGFASARGEAFVATADNASAIYYNPAGITQLEGNNIRGGIYGIYYDPTYTPPAGAANSGITYDVENKVAAAPNVFYTHTMEALPLSFGLGVYAPFGGSVTWPQDTGFRTLAIESELTYLRINPVFAWKVTPTFSIGGGVMVNYSKIDLEQGLLENELPLTNFFRFSGDGWSVGYNFGLLWQPCEKISIGAAFRSTATVTMDGETEFEQYPFPDFYPATSRPAHADFEFPLTAVIGVSYRPTPKWNLEFNADYTDWSSFGTITIYQANPPPPLAPANDLILNWQASWMYEFGVTRYFDNGWHVSAGYLFSQNSVPDAYYTPLAVDMDRHFFSIGTGHKGKRFDFDVLYQFGYGPPHTVVGSSPPSLSGQFSGQTADGTYDFISHAVLITVGMHF